MRQFPQVTLILLLFLIAALLGSLVWLQWSGRPGQATDDRNARLNVPRGGRSDPKSRQPQADSANELQGDNEEPQPSTPGTQDSGTSDTIDVDATVQQQPRRKPPDAELKPDLEQIARDEAKAVADAKRLADLEATFARGAVAEQSRDGLDLNARVVWAVPPHAVLGDVTASLFNAHYCGPFERHPQAAKEVARRLGKKSVSAKEVRDVLADEWVLVGQVELRQAAKGQTDAWLGLDKPPIRVRVLGKPVVANLDGWFAVSFAKADWVKERLRVYADFPGFEVTDTNGEFAAVSLADKPENQTAVTLVMTQVPMLAVKVDYKPVQSAKANLRAWLEVRREVREVPGAAPYQIVLFLEADVPPTGQLTFMLPDPRTWTSVGSGGATIRIGAGGDGWASGTPMVISGWDAKDGRETAMRKGVKYLAIKTSLTLERASTDLVVGRCRMGKADHPGSPVRVEASHTGAVSWSEKDGTFQLWTQLDRGNWKQKLIIEPTFAPSFSFFVDYDSDRPPNVELRKGGSAPAGPWDVRLPSRDGGMMYLSVSGASSGLDVYLETKEGWTPLTLVWGLDGTRLVLCTNWPTWYDQVMIVDRRSGRIQRARLEAYQVSDADFPYGVRVKDVKGDPVDAMKLTPLDD